MIYEGDRVARVELRLPDRSVLGIAQYAYDDRGRLVSVQDSRGLAVSYQYDDENRIVRDEKRGGSVYTIRYAANGRRVYACGSNGYEERSLRYDLDARKTWVTDSHGGVTLYEWNERGQVVQTTTPCKVVTRSEFDELGCPIRQTLANGELRQQTYDELGRIVAERQPNGADTRFQYDDHHRLIGYEESFEDELCTRGVLTYDADHNITSIRINEQPAWTYAWSPYAEPVAFTAPSGAKATRQYDERGGLRRSIDWSGRAWSWTRDALGRVVSETDPVGSVHQVQYLDEHGQSLRLVEPDGRIYEREVSRDGRFVQARFPGRRTRTFELSFCGQPIELHDEQGGVTRLSWGTEPGELLGITNPNRAEYTFTYDADMRIVGWRTFDGRSVRKEWDGDRVAASVDAKGRRTTYTYDARGLLATQVNDDGETAFHHDRRGLLASVKTPSSELRMWRDDIGRVVAEDQDGVRIDRTLDAMGRPLTQKTSYGADTAFAWTPGGDCTEIRYGETSIAFERDAFGRETKRRLGSAGVFEQAYDAVGRLVGQTFRRATKGGVAGADVVGVSRQFGFDERGFLATIQDSLRGHTRLMHDDLGDLTGVIRQRGTSDLYAYDPAQNRVYHAATEHGAALAAAMDRSASSVPVDLLVSQYPHVEQNEGYVPGNRLVTVSRTDGTRTDLTYDANGQVIAKTILRGPERETWRYEWNARGQLAAVVTPNGKTWTYRYDGAGRRTEKRSPAGDVWRYVWIGGDLAQTLKNSELVETYVHEPGGKCPVLRDDGELHYILPDQNQSPSEEVDAKGSLGWTSRKGTWGEQAGGGTAPPAANRFSASGTTPRAVSTITAFVITIRS